MTRQPRPRQYSAAADEPDRWEHYPHDADVGVRGHGATPPQSVRAGGACGPGHPELPEAFRETGQPVLIGGSMGTASYVLAGTSAAEALSFSSSCHGAGRAMSRHEAMRTWHGSRLVKSLARRGIVIRGHSTHGIAEEVPGAYKNVDAVVQVAHDAGISRKVARLAPVICVKG